MPPSTRAASSPVHESPAAGTRRSSDLIRAACQIGRKSAGKWHPEPALGAGHQIFRGIAEYRNSRLMMGVTPMEQKRKPQKPMRRFRPTMPATRHSAKYASTSSRTIEARSEEHTSELQSPCNLVCRLL